VVNSYLVNSDEQNRPHSGKLRRTATDVADVTFTADGAIVQLRHSKTDVEAEGRKVGLPFGSHPLTCRCAPCATGVLTAASRAGRSSAPSIDMATSKLGALRTSLLHLIIKRCANDAGLDSENTQGIVCGQCWRPPR
jgi:hypothetical protein